MTHETDMLTGRLLLAGAAGAALWTGSWLVQGALRPGYDPVRHYVSQLSLGPGGEVQVATFLLTGLLMVAFAAGVWRAARAPWGAALLAVFGTGLVVAGLFPPDPGLNAYPPGTAIPPDSPTPSFQVHILAAVAVFAGLSVACLVLARRGRSPGFAAYSVVSGIAVFVLWAGSTVLSGDGTAPIDPYVGLVQRVYLVVGFGWVAACALRLRRLAGTATATARTTPAVRGL